MSSTITRCCICALESDRGVTDRHGRFVCEECLERARQQILARKAREAQKKIDALKAQQVARAEQDNALVLELRESLDPALALLCPSCGRLMLLDTGGCRSCGYGLDDEVKGKKRSLFGRHSQSTRTPPPQLAPDLSWLPEPDPVITRAMPWLVAVILIGAFTAGFKSESMRIASEVLAVCLHGAFTIVVLAISTSRGSRTMSVLSAPLLLTFSLFMLVQRTNLAIASWTPWIALGITILFHTWYVAHNVRGMLKILFLNSALASVAIIVRHLSVTGVW